MNVRRVRSGSLRRHLALCMIILGAFASSAVAASSATAAEWKVGGSTLVGSATHDSSTASGFTLGWTWGGAPITITASGVESLHGSIFNSGGLAAGEEALRWTGAKVASLPGCAVKGNAIQTNNLRTKLISVNGVTYERIEPTTGTNWGTIFIVAGTGSCSIAGSYVFSGWAAAEVPNIGVEQVSHELKLSPAIQKAAGAELKFGASRFELAGSLVESLSGTNSGQLWSAS